jgi:serine/threonine-protein kinase CTR1
VLKIDGRTVSRCVQQGVKVGQGSFGDVYCCKWSGRVVALKIISSDLSDNDKALKEFVDEMDVLCRLDHPNVIAIHGACLEPKSLCYVCEFAEKGSLFDVLHHKTHQAKLTWPRRLKLAADAARGMLYLHAKERRIVHRDLKSMNLLVFANWSCKVADFGIFREQHATFLSTQSTAGSPAWMAPEMLRGEKTTEKVDVYSFGVILWEIVTLQKPWAHIKSFQELITVVGIKDNRLALPDPWPENCPRSVEDIIRRCFLAAKDRPSFEEIYVALEAAIQVVDPGWVYTPPKTWQDEQNPTSP